MANYKTTVKDRKTGKILLTFFWKSITLGDSKTMKSLTLKDAVEAVVADFASQGKQFSAYDVTKEIRSRSKNQYDITDAVDYGSGYKEVEHTKVRSFVHSLIRSKGSDFQTDNRMGYIVYTPVANGSSSSVASFVGAPAATIQQAPVATLGTVLPSDAKDKAIAYLANSGGGWRTLKEVQSVLKRSGNFTCQQIYNTLSKTARVAIGPNRNALSKSTARYV